MEIMQMVMFVGFHENWYWKANKQSVLRVWGEKEERGGGGGGVADELA